MGKKDTRAILKSIVIVFVTISAGWLSGCTSPTNHSPNNSMMSYLVLSDIDGSILENAYIDYQTFKQSMSYE
jgi:hypothetical protein